MNPNGNFQLRIKVFEAFGLQRADRNGSADPYVVAKLRGKPMSGVKTSQMKNTLNPVWNQDLMLYPKGVNEILVLKIYDHDSFKKNNFLGMVEIPLERFFLQGVKETWLQLMKRKAGWKKLFGAKPTFISASGQIHIQLWFGNSNQALTDSGMTAANLNPLPVQNQTPQPVAASEFVAPVDNSALNAAPTVVQEESDSFTRTSLPSISSTPSEPVIFESKDTVIDMPSATGLSGSGSNNFHSGYLEVDSPDKFQWYKPTPNSTFTNNVVAPSTAI